MTLDENSVSDNAEIGFVNAFLRGCERPRLAIIALWTELEDQIREHRAGDRIK
jgi:hypothetical protein